MKCTRWSHCKCTITLFYTVIHHVKKMPDCVFTLFVVDVVVVVVVEMVDVLLRLEMVDGFCTDIVKLNVWLQC